ncbi:butyrophilin subfamily 1 member A1-like isoform X3 [Pyxicephalus adspersus]|uniref:butyrophilin subfamily 1 member A1-like isoform X3 n=1 Tax=Pyxicephalus adspersus TaxID=30357 RepID=UPI003B5C0B7C
MTMERASLFFHITLLATSVSGKFQVQSTDSRQVVEVGSDALLQCSLTPPLGPVGLKVHWFRSLYHSTVFLMKNGQEEKDQQSDEYAGRASLRNGTGSSDLTLLLRNVVLSDADTYHCFVEDIASGLYDEAVIQLAVIDEMFPRLSSWAYAFLFAFFLILGGAAFVFFAMKRQIAEKEALRTQNGELCSEVDWRKAVMNPAYIRFSPETAYPELSVTGDLLTLMNQPPPATPAQSDARFETERCCLGFPPFTDGCHYWEVEVGDGLEWAVGVASPHLQRKGDAYMFRPQALIWCIARFTDAFTALDTKESPLPVVGGTLEKVGVYLNLSGPRELHLYDSRSWDRLYSFTDVGQERERVLPFFWLGKNGGNLKLKSQNGGRNDNEIN